MRQVRITAPIISEVELRELANRDDAPGMSVYTKIHNAKSTRKDGSILIDVNDDELRELYNEADYWSDSFDQYMMPRGEWLAYRALKKQCQRLMANA